MKTWLFNPFRYVAGCKALLYGMIALLATAVIAYFSHAGFHAILQMHPGAPSRIWASITEQMAAWVTTTVIFYILGVILSSSSVRIVDLAGTMALARWPMIFVAATFFLHPQPVHLIVGQMPETSLIVCALVSLPFLVWMIALMYNAFTTSCNLRGGKAVIGFIVGLIVSDMIVRLLLGWYYVRVLHIHLGV